MCHQLALISVLPLQRMNRHLLTNPRNRNAATVQYEYNRTPFRLFRREVLEDVANRNMRFNHAGTGRIGIVLQTRRDQAGRNKHYVNN